MAISTIVFWLVLLALVIYVISIYNTLVTLKNRYLNAFAQIEVQLDPVAEAGRQVHGGAAGGAGSEGCAGHRRGQCRARVTDVEAQSIKGVALTGGQAADDIGDEAGWHGHGAIGLDLARYPYRDPDLEVGGR